MKFLFKRKRATRTDTRQNLVASVAIKLYDRLQTGWAMWMTKRTASLSLKNWVVVLTVFVALSGGYSLFLFVKGFTVEKENTFQITPIRRPAHATEDGDMPRMPIDSIAFNDSLQLHFLEELAKSY